jgi:serine protein kinase
MGPPEKEVRPPQQCPYLAVEGGPASKDRERGAPWYLSEKDRVGIGTFQPKDEKNQDSTELTGDINYRKIAELRQRQRPARVQLRRRVQRRQPRHHRVHRSAEARRGVPLRPAGREPGAQDQAEEVRADRHRRGDHRPHQRARVRRLQNNEFMEALRDRTVKIDIPYVTRSPTRSRSTRRTYNREACPASTSPRTRSRSRRCGPS